MCFSSRKNVSTDKELDHSTRPGPVAKVDLVCGVVTAPQNYSNSTQ